MFSDAIELSMANLSVGCARNSILLFERDEEEELRLLKPTKFRKDVLRLEPKFLRFCLTWTTIERPGGSSERILNDI